MSRFARDEKPTTQSGGKPDAETVRQAVSETLQTYLQNNQQSQLPAPVPSDIGNAVGWWIKTMQEPERWYERPYTVSVLGNGGSRWEYGYQSRVVTALRKFLRMSKQDRDCIVRAKEDGVYWRGESIDTLMRICMQAEEMRKVGIKQYTRAIAPGLAEMRRKSRAAA